MILQLNFATKLYCVIDNNVKYMSIV